MLWDADPYRLPGVSDLDVHDTAGARGRRDDDDYFLPPPNPGQRTPYTLPDSDRRRLDLHVALTVAGLAPQPGDLDAIDTLCALDGVIVSTVQRWITQAAES
ncbi:hypothetical protein GUY61_22650 [Streptomyces sp. GC420]|nr:hypothetical protein [Streptomyces sp. GC420]